MKKKHKQPKEKRCYLLVIPGILPTYNEAINAAKTKISNGKHWGGSAYEGHKTRAIQKVKDIAAVQLQGIRIEGNCMLMFRWFRKSRTFDPDNIAHAKKYILDGLQAAGVLPNDGWKNTGAGHCDLFYLDKNERIELYILENYELNISPPEPLNLDQVTRVQW